MFWYAAFRGKYGDTDSFCTFFGQSVLRSLIDFCTFCKWSALNTQEKGIYFFFFVKTTYGGTAL